MDSLQQRLAAMEEELPSRNYQQRKGKWWSTIHFKIRVFREKRAEKEYQQIPESTKKNQSDHNKINQLEQSYIAEINAEHLPYKVTETLIQAINAARNGFKDYGSISYSPAYQRLLKYADELAHKHGTQIDRRLTSLPHDMYEIAKYEILPQRIKKIKTEIARLRNQPITINNSEYWLQRDIESRERQLKIFEKELR